MGGFGGFLKTVGKAAGKAAKAGAASYEQSTGKQQSADSSEESPGRKVGTLARKGMKYLTKGTPKTKGGPTKAGSGKDMY